VVRQLTLEDAANLPMNDAGAFPGNLELSGLRASKISDIAFLRSAGGRMNAEDGSGLSIERVTMTGTGNFGGVRITGSRFEDITVTDFGLAFLSGSENQY